MHGRLKLLVAGLLFLLPLVTYVPALSCGTIWDDDDYVNNNQNLRSTEGLARIWTEPRSIPQYYPLVHTTYWIEYQLFGLDHRVYHLVNVLLHGASVVLLWGLLRRLGVPGAALAAAVFAVHPVHVETVTWITERKNVLSGVCYLGAATAWLRFRPPDDGKPAGAGAWALAFFLFVGALCSKTVTASLPAALLLVTYWKRGRIGWKRDVLPLLPFFVIGIVLGMHTAHLERTHVGATGACWDFSFVERTLIAGRAVWFYAWKLVWPHPLMFIYPRWTIDAGAAWQYAFPAGAGLAVLGLWLVRGAIGRGPLVAVLFFGGSLLPASGYFDVYPMRFSFVADHFQYLASLGLIVLLCTGAARLPVGHAARWIGGVLLVLVLATLARRQQADYTDVYTLWKNTVKKNPECWIGHESLGFYSQQQQSWSEAIYYFTRATEIEPDEARSHDSLGTAYLASGDAESALKAYTRAVELRPGFVMARTNKAAALAQLAFLDEAEAELTEALRLEPDNVQALVNLAKLEEHRGNKARVRELTDRVLTLVPAHEEALRLRTEAEE